MPRNVTITLANGTKHTYRNVPDNVTPDQIEQRAAKDFPRVRVTDISGGRTAPASKPAPKQETPGRLRSFGEGLLQGFENVVSLPGDLLTSGLAALGETRAKEIVKHSPQEARAREARLAPYAQGRPNYFTAGKIVGETLTSAPIVSAGGGLIAGAGGRLAATAPRAARVVQNVGRAVQSGGIGAGRTAKATAAMPRLARAAELGQRMAGGAIAGAGGAALTRQDVGEGAAFGAGLPVVASVLRRVAGKAVDLTKLPRQKAAQIIRESLGTNEDAARAAFAQLSPDDQRLARQVLVDAGVEPRVFMGLGADVERQLPDEVGLVLERQAQERMARLAEAAGGDTMEQVRAAARGGRKSVTKAMEPVREEMYRRAGYANEFVPVNLAQAANLEDLAAEQGARARRFAQGAIRGETALGQMDDLGDIFNPEAVVRQRGVVGAMTKRGEKAAKTAIAARERARDIYDEVDALAAEGIQPLRAADLIAPLRAKLADPEIAVDTLESNTIRGVVRKLEAATDQNGMLNPRALGKIMRSGIGDLVEMWSKKVSSGAAPTSGTVQRGQSLGLEMRDMIKDALRQSGAGDLVDEFFKRSEEGYAAVNRGELAGEALRLYKQDPSTAAEFRALVGGDRPKVVGKIMGGGPESESFAGAFASDPNRLAALQQSAREMETLNRMAELGREGGYAASELAYRERPSILTRGLTGMTLFPSAPARIAAQGAEMATSAYLAPRVQKELAEGFLTGQNAMALMNQFPTSLELSEAVSKMSPQTRNALAQFLRNYTMSPSPAGPTE